MCNVQIILFFCYHFLVNKDDYKSYFYCANTSQANRMQIHVSVAHCHYINAVLTNFTIYFKFIICLYITV